MNRHTPQLRDSPPHVNLPLLEVWRSSMDWVKREEYASSALPGRLYLKLPHISPSRSFLLASAKTPTKVTDVAAAELDEFD